MAGWLPGNAATSEKEAERVDGMARQTLHRMKHSMKSKRSANMLAPSSMFLRATILDIGPILAAITWKKRGPDEAVEEVQQEGKVRRAGNRKKDEELEGPLHG